MKPKGTLLLKRKNIVNIIEYDEYITSVEEAFKMYALGQALSQGILHIDSTDGEFHIKAGGIEVNNKIYFALKANSGFFKNLERFGLPNIQGVIVLFDGNTGFPLAIMDSTEITLQRTAAAVSIATKYLARPDSKIATICGCGNQGRNQLKALKHVLPIERVFVFDRDEQKAIRFAADVSSNSENAIDPVQDLEKAVIQSDVVVTCTPSKRFFLSKKSVSPGTFISAIGADSPEKQEIDPQLLVGNKVVVDVLDQCAEVGELHHSLDRGILTKEDVHGELGAIVAGLISGRTSDEEIIVFDSTGSAVQDVAAAVSVYEKALSLDRDLLIDFFG